VASLDESRPYLRRWDLTQFSSPEPSIPITGNESIADVTDSTRNEPEEHDPGPRPTEASKDLEDRVRFRVGRVIHDQNHAGQFNGASHPLLDHRLTGKRLLCSEAKHSGRIATDHESHPAVAQIADSVEQNNRRWRCSSHQLRVQTKIADHSLWSTTFGEKVPQKAYGKYQNVSSRLQPNMAINETKLQELIEHDRNERNGKRLFLAKVKQRVVS
jgi:hypothetical protein